MTALEPPWRQVVAVHDDLRQRFESAGARHLIGRLLVTGFLGTAALVQLARWGLLPGGLAALLPASHFFAVHVAFTLLLLIEVVALVFSLGRSVANSVGKQFEILSLILLRQTFEQFTHLPEPVTWEAVRVALPAMGADATGALAIFVTLGFYYRLQRHQPITPEGEERQSFVATKKGVGLLLLAALAGLAGHDSWLWATGQATYPFFEAFYTLLIFSDVLIVLVAFRSSSTYAVVFRNSGFAASTVLLRTALSAPAPVNASLGLGAALFALALTSAYNRFAPEEVPAAA